MLSEFILIQCTHTYTHMHKISNDIAREDERDLRIAYFARELIISDTVDQ